ncbi:MAG: hypothetical protein QHH07_09590 [Sedimentisphaerales bacterium]|jgi:hypothetical protein|nr:hypothetical protein [Sedimentisphaerales bacterium]
MARVREFDQVELQVQPLLDQARRGGIYIELSPVFKTPDEVRQGSWLFLDMVEDGLILYDTGFLSGYLADLRARLDRLGARRITNGEAWYWDLKPDYQPGDVIDMW